MIFQRRAEIAEATPVRFFMAVYDAEGVRAAGSEQKVMSSHGVFNQVEHDIAAIGIEGMTGGQKDRFRIVDGPA